MTDKSSAMFELRNVTKTYKRAGKQLSAVNDISLAIKKGESLAIIGESGAGKSTLGKLLIKQVNPSSGTIFYNNKDITRINAKEQKAYWKDVQMITQDPSVAFNPKMRVHRILFEPLKNFGICPQSEYQTRMENLLHSIGLDGSYLDRLPSQMSGGEQQRISLARALAVEPTCLILDEATSALDMTLQEQLIDLLVNIQKDKNLTYIFIHHDLGVAQKIANRIVVMKSAKIVETIESTNLAHSSDEYVSKLVDAVFALNEPRGAMFEKSDSFD